MESDIYTREKKDTFLHKTVYSHSNNVAKVIEHVQ